MANEPKVYANGWKPCSGNVSRKSRPMGQASRTTKLLLDLSDRGDGGANTSKRVYLEETGKILDAARAFYLAFFLAHPDKLTERVRYFSEKLQQERELLSWAEALTVETAAIPLRCLLTTSANSSLISHSSIVVQ